MKIYILFLCILTIAACKLSPYTKDDRGDSDPDIGPTKISTDVSEVLVCPLVCTGSYLAPAGKAVYDPTSLSDGTGVKYSNWQISNLSDKPDSLDDLCPGTGTVDINVVLSITDANGTPKPKVAVTYNIVGAIDTMEAFRCTDSCGFIRAKFGVNIPQEYGVTKGGSIIVSSGPLMSDSIPISVKTKDQESVTQCEGEEEL